jgi:hypothetical protein
VVSTSEAVSCRGSRNHPLLLPRQRGKAPVAENRSDARGPKTAGNQHGYGEKGGFHGPSSVLPRQQKSTPSAAAAARAGPVAENRSDARGPKTPGNHHGYGERVVSTPGNQSTAAAAEIAHFCCRGNERKTVALCRSNVLQGSRRGLCPSGILGGEGRLASNVLPRQQKSPPSAAAATRKNCGALRVQCTAGVSEGAMALGYIGG